MCPPKSIAQLQRGTGLEPIDKADELPVHNRKGVGNQKEKGGGKFIEALKG